jgi:hypothetical protein
MWLTAVGAAGVPAGCEPARDEIDPYPIAVSLDGGSLMAYARTPPLDDDVRTIVIDTGSPLTTVDPESDVVGRAIVDFTLVQADEARTSRARFAGITAVLSRVEAIGLGIKRDIQAVLGADTLKSMAVRLEPSTSSIRFFPDIAGTKTQHEDDCEVVIGAALEGGGQIVIAESTIRFEPTRIVLSTCLGAPPVELDVNERVDFDEEVAIPSGGADAALVLATGLPITVLTRSAYDRTPGHLPIDCATESRLYLPGGDPDGELVKIGFIPHLAITDSPADGRGPCVELRAGRIMERCGCLAEDPGRPPCDNPGDAFTTNGAIELGHVEDSQPGVVLPDAGVPDAGAPDCTPPATPTIPVAVIADTHPLIQGVRAELRPDVAEIDGFLGMSTLFDLAVDIDYPNARLLFRCLEGTETTCLTRPSLRTNKDNRADAVACMASRRPQQASECLRE